MEEFITKGEKLMEDPKSPKFLGNYCKQSQQEKNYFFFILASLPQGFILILENHVNKLKEAWTLANEKAQERKNALGK